MPSSPEHVVVGSPRSVVDHTQPGVLKSPPFYPLPICQPVSPSRNNKERRHQDTSAEFVGKRRPLQSVVTFPRRSSSCRSDLTLDSERDDNHNNNDVFQRVQLHLQYNDVNLTQLCLDHCQLGDAGAAQLSNALLFNHVVHELRLVNNGITSKGMLDLCRSMGLNQANVIQKLHMSSNPIGDDGVLAIADYIQYQSHSRITSLWLMATHMSDAGESALTKALLFNPTMEELYLQDNCIGPAGATAMASWLSTDTVLRVLNLHKNTLGNAGLVTLIQKGLIQNESSRLEQFIVSANGIGNDAAVVMGAYLGWNPTLRMLDLSMNHIGDAGLHVMAMGLTHNFRLSYWNLGHNDSITDRGILSLAKGLERNTQLQSLCLNGNTNVTEIGVRALARALMTNRSLVVMSGLTEMEVDASLMQAIQLMLEQNRVNGNV